MRDFASPLLFQTHLITGETALNNAKKIIYDTHLSYVACRTKHKTVNLFIVMDYQKCFALAYHNYWLACTSFSHTICSEEHTTHLFKIFTQQPKASSEMPSLHLKAFSSALGICLCEAAEHLISLMLLCVIKGHTLSNNSDFCYLSCNFTLTKE